MRTENGFYYSFYDQLVREDPAPNFMDLIYDQRTEYPTEVNALKRFNIWQEVILAYTYRWCPLLWMNMS